MITAISANPISLNQISSSAGQNESTIPSFSRGGLPRISVSVSSTLQKDSVTQASLLPDYTISLKSLQTDFTTFNPTALDE